MTTNQEPKSRAVSKPHQATGNAVEYVRASTGEKLRQNATAQTADLLLLLNQLGFSEDQIIVIE